MKSSTLRQPSVKVAKKKVSIMLPPMHNTSSSTNSKEQREKRERTRTLSLKSISTVSIGELEPSDNLNRIELRRLRHSTLLGLPSGFTLQSDSFYNPLSHSENFRIHRESKALYLWGQVRLSNAVPILKFRVAVFCLVLNVICPGLGTMVASFSCLLFPCNNYMKEKRWTFFAWNFMVAVSQIVGIVYLLIGYFWGIIWGVYMVQVADRTKKVADVPVLKQKITSKLNSTRFWENQTKTFDCSDEDDVIENLTHVV